jgi:hypothetical protein
MKKFIILTIALSLIITGCGKTQTPPTEKDIKLEKASQQINNYMNYQPDLDELSNIVSYEGMNYYYASNNKRYTFPNETIFHSWFSDTQVSTIPTADLEVLYETPLGGNVSLRPGTLMMTETDPKIYMITNDNEMKIFGNLTLLKSLYGDNYQDLITDIPNRFYTQYKNTGAINQPEQIPELPINISIDQNLGF